MNGLLLPGILLSIGADSVPSDAEILVDGFPRAAEIAGKSRLRSVIVPWAGIPSETLQTLRAIPKLSLHNLPYNIAPTAETALALLLSAAKSVPYFDKALRKGIWTPTPAPGSVMLEQRTAVILGYGAVGQRVAAGCRSLRMTVIGIRRTEGVQIIDNHTEVHGVSALPKVLPIADALVVCVPETAETVGLIGPGELNLLPPHAVLVNVARGPVVDEEALFKCLEARRIFAAGLDVWYRYPTDEQRHNARPCPPSRFPFHDLDNVVISPHRAGWSEETEHARVSLLIEVLNTAKRGHELPYRIDLDRGY
jgi:phosphoglycerate dehydrogenase-like enzyme